jgi:5-methylcytosine-specific restriction endonuclease McrA
MSVVAEQLRAAVVARAGGRCEYCLFPEQWNLGEFEVDHIVPRSQGGPTALENLALACPLCNSHKWAHQQGTDPGTGDSVPLFHPRTQAWRKHLSASSPNMNAIRTLALWNSVSVWCIGISQLRVHDCWQP